MAEKSKDGKAPQPASKAASGRGERLAQALRQNLKRRKAQSRERAGGSGGPGDGGPER